MANKKTIIDEIEENDPIFEKAQIGHLKNHLKILEKSLRKNKEDLEIAQAALNYKDKKLKSWKNKYYVLINKNVKDEKSI
jgi:hypothetical protein